MTNIIIMGIGGVGSNLAYMLSKSPTVERITLVDFDIIEYKNLERQFFIKEDIGKNKAEAMAGYLEQFAPEKEVFWFDRKIETEEQLSDFNKEDFVFLCTDNVESKKLISKYFYDKLVIGCDDNLVEFRKSYEGESVWSIGEGYNSTQNFESNLFSATFAYSLFIRDEWNNLPSGKTTITLSKLVKEARENKFDRIREEPPPRPTTTRNNRSTSSEPIEFVIEGDSETINVEVDH